MPRKKKDLSKENEILNAEVDITGAGEQPVVRDLIQKLPEASNTEALDIALALQQLVRGNAALLENQKVMGEEIARLKAHMAERDAVAAKEREDHDKFVAEVLDKAEKLKATGSAKDKFIAQGANIYAEEMNKANANARVAELELSEKLSKMPKVLVVSPGRLEMVVENNAQVARLFKEEVRIGKNVYILEPNVPTMVPQAVAEILANRNRSNQETAAYGAELQKYQELPELQANLKKVSSDVEYKAGQ